jgi:hypothetical protein
MLFRTIQYLLIFSAPMLLSADIHEYYVSVTRANYNPASARLEISMKLFTDDLERTITQNSGEVLKLSSIEDAASAEDFFVDYMGTQFTVIQDGELMDFTFIGFEPGPDETWLYAEIKMPPQGAFVFKNTLLFDVFPEQINIMHLKANNAEQSHYFTGDKPQIQITL